MVEWFFAISSEANPASKVYHFSFWHVVLCYSKLFLNIVEVANSTFLDFAPIFVYRNVRKLISWWAVLCIFNTTFLQHIFNTFEFLFTLKNTFAFFSVAHAKASLCRVYILFFTLLCSYLCCCILWSLLSFVSAMVKDNDVLERQRNITFINSTRAMMFDDDVASARAVVYSLF